MTFKQKPLTLALGILILIAIVASGLFTFGKKLKDQKLGAGPGQLSQTQASESAQNSTNSQSFPPAVPLVSNLPSGVAASAIGPVEGKSGEANVIAVSDGKTFSLVLEAKLADPSNNQFYEAWLAKNSSDNNLFKIGKLNRDKDSYTTSFSKDGDFSEYKVAVVTLETNEDDIAETKILEGSF